jgi:hypothetical protein
MFSTVLQELKGYFGRDFLLSAFFPVLFFAGLSLMLFLEITQGLNAALTGWEKLPVISRSLIGIGGSVVVVVFAYLLYNFQYSLIRLFEGYWPRRRFFLWLRNRRRRPTSGFGSACTARHNRQAHPRKPMRFGQNCWLSTHRRHIWIK